MHKLLIAFILIVLLVVAPPLNPRLIDTLLRKARITPTEAIAVPADAGYPAPGETPLPPTLPAPSGYPAPPQPTVPAPGGYPGPQMTANPWPTSTPTATPTSTLTPTATEIIIAPVPFVPPTVSGCSLPICMP